MRSRVVPHDLDAERLVLGSMLLYADARAAVATTLVAEDFYLPYHGRVFRALLATMAEGRPVELTALAARLEATGSPVAKSSLLELQAEGSFAWSASIGRVAECAARRRLIASAESLRDAAYDPARDFSDTLAAWGRAVDQIRAPDVETEAATEIVELEAGEEHAWVIPGVMRRRERLILTGGEGAGKSFLGRWVAMCVAAGRAPFAPQETIEPLPTLLIDLENEAGDIGDSARSIASSIGYRGGCHARARPQGVDLTDARDVRWLRSIVAGERPALLLIGPLYKMYRGAETRSKASEESAEIVAEVLDDIRVAYDCALWIEAHAPHGEGGRRDGGRPRGSSLWMGWPNFGRYLRRLPDDPKIVQLESWRGDRHRRRSWPWGLRESDGRYPWRALWERPGIAATWDDDDEIESREAVLL